MDFVIDDNEEGKENPWWIFITVPGSKSLIHFGIFEKYKRGGL